MTSAIFYMLLFVVLVLVCIKPLGWYMARVYMGRHIWLKKPLGWLEELIYKCCGIDPDEEMGWRTYALSLIMLGFFGFWLLFCIFRFQHLLPLNPMEFPGLASHTAMNAAISFVTNTNWQSYSGETTLSYFSQAVGIVVQQFLSAATGMAVAVALFRGLARKKSDTLGNAWVDVVRGTLYILLPLALIFSLILASQGVVQNFGSYVHYEPLEAKADVPYLMAQGPAASQTAIKMLGSNGGGFFNANGAHPFENPNEITNLLSLVSLLLIPASMVYCFGVMVGDRRQAWTLLLAMFVIFVPLLWLTQDFEMAGNPRFDSEVIDQSMGNMEGKEMRFGVTSSALWAVATTATSHGSVNAMHDSFTPLGGMIPLIFIKFGEVIFGGVGSGAYGMLVYVLLTVFLGGLMVGRTPEYLGKKLGAFEIKMASLCIVIPAVCVLLGTAIAVVSSRGDAGVFNPGAQGFSEILYAVASASNNNGSALAGLNANTPFYNTLLGILMLAGRYGIFVPLLALAGALATKNKVPSGLGTLPTHTPLFATMLVGSILLLDVLTYIPALALGPIAEHMQLYQVGVAP